MTIGAWITIVILIAAVAWLVVKQLKLRSDIAERDKRILEDNEQIAKDQQTLTDNQRIIRDLIKKANDADALAKQLNEKYSNIINVESHIAQLQATSHEETRIEEQLRRSPQAQAEWQRHQMELEEQIERNDEAVELAETP